MAGASDLGKDSTRLTAQQIFESVLDNARDELGRPLTFLGVAEARLQFSLQIIDTDAMAQAGAVVHAFDAIQFADV